MRIINENCLDTMMFMEDNSIDSIVTDPPYGLAFMGKKWDYEIPSVEIWKECLRVLKPGGYLLSFAGTRTQHRMACNIEDAGFEIRDMIAWIYGSGFPKSHNIGKSMDKVLGNEREDLGKNKFEHLNGKSNLNCYGKASRPNETKGNSKYEGWGTALKPALETITVARKPLSEKTIAANVLKYGTGGINIDGCRVPLDGDYKCAANGRPSQTGLDDKYDPTTANTHIEQGRFPANLIHDGSDDVLGIFPESKARFFYCAKASKADRNEGLEGFNEKQYSHDGRDKEIENAYQRNKSVSKNGHPTVKPTKLMRYLVRLVTPTGGTVYDPFTGSGSTGKACAYEGFDFIGSELDADNEGHCDVARARIAFAMAGDLY